MNPTQQTLELLKVIDGMGGLGKLDAGQLAKAGITISTGLVAYDLEPVAQRMYPVLTPLRNSIPRVGGGVGTGVHYMQITGVTPTSPGVAEGHRGGVLGTTVVPKAAAWATLGQENAVSFEAEESSLPGTDNRALAALTMLDSLMIQEEMVILGGNASLALLQTHQPTVQDVAPAPGQSFKAKTKYTVNCVALTLEGYLTASVANGIKTAVIRTNADGIQDTFGGGSAQVSAPQDCITGDDANDTHGLKCSVVPTPGAVAYAWYVGPNGGDIKLTAITTLNSILLTSPAAVGPQKVSDLPASDNSCNLLLYDGLITDICAANSGAYLKAMPTGTPGVGSPLNYDGAGGIVEFNDACRYFWDAVLVPGGQPLRLRPNVAYCNTEQLVDINNKVMSGGGAPTVHFIVDMNNPAQQALTAGRQVGWITNKIGGGPPIELINHPTMPRGMIIFRCLTIPYALPNVVNIMQIKTIRDYYQMDWPLKTRQYEMGVYTRGVKMNRFPPALGMIYNIAPS